MVPSSTYRVQLNKDFTFRHLEQITDYLYDLGISTIYASPFFKAIKGSDHGYDVVDPHMINDEIGTLDEFRHLSKKLKERGMTWIQDIVPNHMAVIDTNYRLWDVLERGRVSPFQDYFDIDWEHPELKNKILLPFLEATLSWCIANDKIEIGFTNKGFGLCYYENFYPVKIELYDLLLAQCGVERHLYEDALCTIISQKELDYNSWRKSKMFFVTHLLKYDSTIQAALSKINADKRFLTGIINEQHYKLEWYEVSDKLINYRRFFTINSLICLRMEDEKVFKDYHSLIKKLYDEGLIQGLRIDHIDGLKNPVAYINSLRNLFGNDCYIIAEKILEIKEQLPAAFDIQGTSGYEFLSYINQVVTKMNSSEKLLSFYKKLVPEFADYDDTVFKNKFSFLDKSMHGEWNNLLRLLFSLNIIDEREICHEDLKQALGVLMAAFPVYRIYINEFPIDEYGNEIIAKAFDVARMRRHDLAKAFDILENLFCANEKKTDERLQFLQRLMQFTGPLAAKGVEDTTFYQYNPLISHNEVGDLPCVLGISIDEFHKKMTQRQLLNPLSLNNTSTHDTKRGEDARIRINVLSEFADEWITLVKQFVNENRQFKKMINGVLSPVVNDEYFLYQSIVGGLAEDFCVTDECRNRLKDLYTKALREAKYISTHTNPHTAYEQACSEFIDHLFNPNHSFIQKMIDFVKTIIPYTNAYTLLQVMIKSTAPGIPDFYQGCELWDLSYVDPDNRGKVNYEIRKQLLNELLIAETNGAETVLKWAMEKRMQGAAKMFVTRKLAHLRKENNNLFIEGEYLPLTAFIEKCKVIAYARRKEHNWIIVVAPVGLRGVSKNDLNAIKINLPKDAPYEWRNIFTDEMIKANSEMQIQNLFTKFQIIVLKGKAK